MQRLLSPEILDSLPHDSPDAVASRRDLRLINNIMGNHRWIRSEIRARKESISSILELGAGFGDLGFQLRNELKVFAAVDRCPRPPSWPASWQWYQADLLHWSGYGNYSTFVVNLVLHHFADDELAILGSKLSSSANLLIISEPARRRIHQWQSKLLWPLGVNYVTRHDAHVSIAAGFVDQELPDRLGLQRSDWNIQVHQTTVGAYRMIAQRR